MNGFYNLVWLPVPIPISMGKDGVDGPGFGTIPYFLRDERDEKRLFVAMRYGICAPKLRPDLRLAAETQWQQQGTGSVPRAYGGTADRPNVLMPEQQGTADLTLGDFDDIDNLPKGMRFVRMIPRRGLQTIDHVTTEEASSGAFELVDWDTGEPLNITRALAILRANHGGVERELVSYMESTASPPQSAMAFLSETMAGEHTSNEIASVDHYHYGLDNQMPTIPQRHMHEMHSSELGTAGTNTTDTADHQPFTVLLFAYGTASAPLFNSDEGKLVHMLRLPVVVKVRVENNPYHIERIETAYPSAISWHSAEECLDDIRNGSVSQEEVHTDMFEGTADCRSRSGMRKLNGYVSASAAASHGLWWQMFDVIAFGKPLTGLLELTPPDSETNEDYDAGVEFLESMPYTCSVCTRLPTDFCGDGTRCGTASHNRTPMHSTYR